MANIFYRNSKGEEIHFDNALYYLNRATDLFSYQWNYANADYADRIDKFDLRYQERKIDIAVLSTDDIVYANALDNLYKITGYDVSVVTPGRLYCGEYYLNCYFIASEQNNYDNRVNKVLIPFKIVAENGLWIKEYEYDITPGSIWNGLDYPYDYPHDYNAADSSGYVRNPSVIEADFLMQFYGVAELPGVTINDNEYLVNIDLTANYDYVEINSIKKTVYFHEWNKDPVNIFHYRGKDNDIFKKIPNGTFFVNRNDDFRVRIVLFVYHAVPEWWL